MSKQVQAMADCGCEQHSNKQGFYCRDHKDSANECIIREEDAKSDEPPHDYGSIQTPSEEMLSKIALLEVRNIDECQREIEAYNRHDDHQHQAPTADHQPH